jgi:hypothetical protein
MLSPLQAPLRSDLTAKRSDAAIRRHKPHEGEVVGSMVLTERDGKTILTQTIHCDSRETRDAILKSGMEQGVAASYDRLENILASMAVA